MRKHTREGLPGVRRRDGGVFPRWGGGHRALAAVGAIVVVASLAGTGATPVAAGCPVPSFTYKHGIVTFAESGHTAQVRVEIADTPEEMAVGLMCRTSLDPDAGMLFLFADTTHVAFWMKNTLIPLSIAFIDAGWHIVALMDMPVAPDPENPSETYMPPRPYRYALEVNQGFFARHALDERAVVHFSPQETGRACGGCRADPKGPLPAQ
jgi:uncharacterized protein